LLAITSLPWQELRFSGVLGLGIEEDGDDDCETCALAKLFEDLYMLPNVTRATSGGAMKRHAARLGSGELTDVKHGFAFALARQNSKARSWLCFDCVPHVRHGNWGAAPFEDPLREECPGLASYSYVVKPSRVVLVRPKTGQLTKIDLNDIGDGEDSGTPMGIGSAFPSIRLPSGDYPCRPWCPVLPRPD